MASGGKACRVGVTDSPSRRKMSLASKFEGKRSVKNWICVTYSTLAMAWINFAINHTWISPDVVAYIVNQAARSAVVQLHPGTFTAK